jgi:hypothetical protein
MPLLQNFLQGAVEGGTGVTAAILEGLRQEKEAKVLAQRAKSQGILDSLNQARINETNRMYQQKPEVKKTLPLQHIFAPNGAELWVNPNTMESIPTGKNYAKPEKPTVTKESKPKDTSMTPIQLLNARTKMTNELQPNRQWFYATNKTTGERVDSIPNANYGANVDSAVVANTAPLNLMPQGATSFIPDMNDPEIQKAYQALKDKKIDQATFDDFAHKRMGQ